MKNGGKEVISRDEPPCKVFHPWVRWDYGRGLDLRVCPGAAPAPLRDLKTICSTYQHRVAVFLLTTRDTHFQSPEYFAFTFFQK